MRSPITKLASVVLTCACVCLSHGYRLASRERILPDLAVHLNNAERYIGEGKWQQALAQTDAIMLETPIRVWVDDDVSTADLDQRMKAIDQAMQLWQEGFREETLFVMVSHPSDADVRISFTDTLANDRYFAAGHIEWERTMTSYGDERYSYSYAANIHLALFGPKSKKLTLDQMRHAAAHELGHVLGLQDSERKGDIMAPLDLRRPAKKPRKEEFAALVEVRQAAELIRSQAFALAL